MMNPMMWGGYGMGGGGRGVDQRMPPPQWPPGMTGFPPGGYGGYGDPRGQQGHGGGGYGGPQGGGRFDQGQGVHHGRDGGGQARPKGGGRGKSNLQLSDHLGQEGGQQRPARSKGEKGGGKVQEQIPPAQQECTVPPDELSTVMLRNVPNGYTRGMLLELLNGSGFEAHYDFVYLPMDFRNGVNLGYAFVNLISHQDAAYLTEKLQGFQEWVSDSTKVCEVSWAHPHQGLSEHVERYRNSPVMHPTMPEEYKPMVFRNGQQTAFPQPTKAIKAPKLRLTVREGGKPEDNMPGRGNNPPGFIAVSA